MELSKVFEPGSPSKTHRNHGGPSCLGCRARNQAENTRGSNIWSQVTSADGKQQNAKSVGSGEESQGRKSLITRMKSEPEPKRRQVAVAASLEPKTPGGGKEMGGGKKRATWTNLPVRTNSVTQQPRRGLRGSLQRLFTDACAIAWPLPHPASSCPLLVSPAKLLEPCLKNALAPDSSLCIRF